MRDAKSNLRCLRRRRGCISVCLGLHCREIERFTPPNLSLCMRPCSSSFAPEQCSNPRLHVPAHCESYIFSFGDFAWNIGDLIFWFLIAKTENARVCFLLVAVLFILLIVVLGIALFWSLAGSWFFRGGEESFFQIRKWIRRLGRRDDRIPYNCFGELRFFARWWRSRIRSENVDEKLLRIPIE